jgi:hypothetical protein
MDGQQFDEWTRQLGVALDRKRFLLLLASGVPAAGLSGLEGRAAREKHAKRRKRAKRRGRGEITAQGGIICGTPCQDVADCAECDAAVCFGANDMGVEGNAGGGGTCLSECESLCFTNEDCAGLPGNCVCFEEHCLCDQVCGDACGGACFSNADCPEAANCVCTVNNPGRVAGEGGAGQAAGRCITLTCPGTCASNQDCTAQGAGSCVCFFGPNVNVADVSSEGAIGACGECLARGTSCNASTECCGNLFCEDGLCGGKPEPSRRCHKHGRPCHKDRDCCAQGMCYRGKCGEKDTHCDHNRECARGYRCRGGRRSCGHRRCRKKGRRRQDNRRRK